MSLQGIALGQPADGDDRRRLAWSESEIVAFAATLIIAVGITAFFHDRFLAEVDDGTYAYIADQLRGGAVLHRDIQDPHGGYVHFVNALALDLFGRDLLSLRYPLALLTVTQAALVFVLLRPLLGAGAVFGGLAMSALTFVQFLNPTANWYALFLFVVLAALLAGGVQRRFGGLMLIGFVVGLVFFFRQLTGVFAGMGVLAWLLMADEASDDSGRRPVLAPALAGLMLAGLGGYALFKMDGAAFALYALWPLAFLVMVAFRTRAGDRTTARMAAALTIGAILSAVPLLLYHLANGSLGAWWHDATVTALALTELDFFDSATYARMFALAIHGIFVPSGLAAVLSGIYWLIVLLAPTVLGVAVLRSVRSGAVPHPLAVLALFHGLVSAHYAIPLYAILSTGLVLAGLLAMVRPATWRFHALAGGIMFMAAVGLAYQAGQPLSRGYGGIIRGEQVALDALGPPGASIRIESEMAADHGRLLDFISNHSQPDETVLGLPMLAQANFLSERRTPLPFVIAPLGLLTNDDVASAWSTLQQEMPAVVLYFPKGKYTTPRVAALMDRLRPHYSLCDTVSGIELYARACETSTPRAPAT